jgi:hypothetical protein
MRPTRGRRSGNRAVGKGGRQALDWRITQWKLLRWELPVEPGTRTESSFKAQLKLRQNCACGLSYIFQLENLKCQAPLVWTVLQVRVFTLQKGTSPWEPSENCARQGYYTANRVNSLPMFRDKLIGSIFKGITWRWNHFTLRNSPEKCSSYLLGRSLKSSKGAVCLRLRPRNLVARLMSFYCF